VSCFLADQRPRNTKRSRVRAQFPRRARMFAWLSFLVVAVTAGALNLGNSHALAQAVAQAPAQAPAQERPAAQRDNTRAGNIENGKKVFLSTKCDVCHGNQGQGGAGPVAGPQIVSPGISLPMFIDRVRNPKAPMPAFSAGQVSDAALSDVYAFLKSVAAPAQPSISPNANATNGKQLYTSAGCYECHSREGQGGAGTGPRLAPNPISFAAFARQVRQPSNQMPPYTGKVLSDGQLSDIYAFLQSIPQPPDVASIPLLK
jgi:mono/diheme cytochrome c family protein